MALTRVWLEETAMGRTERSNPGKKATGGSNITRLLNTNTFLDR